MQQLTINIKFSGFILFLMMLLLSTSQVYAQQDTTLSKSELAKLKQEYNNYHDSYTLIKEKLKKCKSSNESLRTEIQNYQTQIGKVENEIADKRKIVADKVEQVKQEIEKQKRELEKLEEARGFKQQLSDLNAEKNQIQSTADQRRQNIEELNKLIELQQINNREQDKELQSFDMSQIMAEKEQYEANSEALKKEIANADTTKLYQEIQKCKQKQATFDEQNKPITDDIQALLEIKYFDVVNSVNQLVESRSYYNNDSELLKNKLQDLEKKYPEDLDFIKKLSNQIKQFDQIAATVSEAEKHLRQKFDNQQVDQSVIRLQQALNKATAQQKTDLNNYISLLKNYCQKNNTAIAIAREAAEYYQQGYIESGQNIIKGKLSQFANYPYLKDQLNKKIYTPSYSVNLNYCN